MGVSKAKVLSGGKSGGNDFHKKKAKVGKKVQRSNVVTSISLKSKRIVMPTGLAPNSRPTNENEMIDKIIKQLQHYSGISRATAIEELKKLMETSSNNENITTMILPHALELIFDDDVNTRKSCVSLISEMLKKFNSTIFASIIPVLITYICSGLTSLNKGQRRDTLSVLLTLALFHSSLLTPYLEKLVSHVLALLTMDDPTTSSGQDAIASSEHNINNSTKNSTNATNTKDNNKKNAKYDNNKTLKNMLLVILEVLVAMLSEGKDFSKVDSILKSRNVAFNDATLLNYFRPISATCKYLYCREINKKIESVINADAMNQLPKPLLGLLCSKLSKVWSGLVLNKSVIMLETTKALNEISNIAQVLGESYACSDLDEYKDLVKTMFHFFPHVSMEASLAIPNSIDENVGNLSVILLDLALSKIILLSLNSGHRTMDNKDYSNLKTTVGEFLLNRLQAYATDDHEDVGFLQEEGAKSIDNNENLSDGEKDEKSTSTTAVATSTKTGNREKGRGILWHTRTQYPKMKKRALLIFFHALQLLLLHEIKVDSMSVYDDNNSSSDSSSFSVANLFSILNSITKRAISNKASNKQILAQSAIKILCSVVIDEELWSNGYPANILISIIETVNTSLDLLLNNIMELEYISYLIINSIHRIMQRSSTELLVSIPSFYQLTDTIESLFHIDEKNKSPTQQCFYLKCNNDLKYQILDICYYTPFQDATKAFKAIVSIISDPTLAIDDERMYLLRILLERKEEIMVDELITLMISSLRQQISLIIKNNSDIDSSYNDHPLHVFMNMNNTNDYNEIIGILSQCISEENICKYMENHYNTIKDFMLPIIQYYHDIQSNL